MSFIRNLRLASRLGLGFASMLFLLAAIVLLALLRLSSVGEATQKIAGEDWAKAEAAATINALVRANAGRTMELFFHETRAERDKVRQHIESNKQQIVAALKTLDRLVYTPQGRELLAQIKPAREAYVASFTRVSQLLESGQREAASQQLIHETLPAIELLQGRVLAMSELQRQLVDASARQVQVQIRDTERLMLAAGLAGLLLGAGLAWVLTRSVTAPLQQAVAVAERVAEGDLSADIEVGSRDETGRLLAALKAMNTSLAHTVDRVRRSSDSIATASSQIEMGNADLSQRTEEQASNLQQTAASMEQLSSTVQSNADAAEQAAVLAQSADRAAALGGDVVRRVAATMGEINADSHRITDIIGVIDGIAFQTNILALSAAVEAARAGEQGRGFAVFFSEEMPPILRERPAQAARWLSELLEGK
ncbi:MAG TPA: methyl-accepting chemotaxis protein, partial [Roseateles sp.]|nr:methyl-accepting chemotaxis protein [Roseateles sp.]